MGKGGKQNQLDSEYRHLTPAQVEAIKNDPNESSDRRQRAIRHLKALKLRNAAKRKK
jgi:hypothetical protein